MINTVQRVTRSPGFTVAAGAMVSIGASALICMSLRAMPESISLADIQRPLTQQPMEASYQAGNSPVYIAHPGAFTVLTKGPDEAGATPRIPTDRGNELVASRPAAPSADRNAGLLQLTEFRRGQDASAAKGVKDAPRQGVVAGKVTEVAYRRVALRTDSARQRVLGG
jgi:hypothetical protein